jgi:hypothetical protein
MNESVPVSDRSGYLQTRKIMCLSFHVRDYRELEAMLLQAQLRIPDLNMDSMISAMIADVLRVRRENNERIKHAGAVPGVESNDSTADLQNGRRDACPT